MGKHNKHQNNPDDNTPNQAQNPELKPIEPLKAEDSGSEPLVDKEKEIEMLKQEIGELTATLQRLQAEFENYKKRCNRENESFVKLANEDLIKKLLPIIDHLELALKAPSAKDEFYKGIELIYAQMMSTLKDCGLESIESLGKRFDPYYHEALLTEESDKANNSVLEELQKGYQLHDKLLRHAKVKIAKQKNNINKELKEE